MNCENIKEVVIPIGVKSIGNDAFGFCKQLTQLEIDMSVSAETSSFEVTPWLKKYIKENGVLILNNKIIKVSSKLTKYKIPDNVKEIGSFAFSKSNIEELYIPDNVKEIKSYAFCLSNIKKIRLPNNLTCIEEGTFSDCQNLEELVFPETVREIDCCALYNIPNCVVTILNKESNALMGDYSFEGYKEEKPYVKEVRAYSGSKAMEAAKLCNLNCTNLDDSIEKIT